MCVTHSTICLNLEYIRTAKCYTFSAPDALDHWAIIWENNRAWLTMRQCPFPSQYPLLQHEMTSLQQPCLLFVMCLGSWETSWSVGWGSICGKMCYLRPESSTTAVGHGKRLVEKDRRAWFAIGVFPQIKPWGIINFTSVPHGKRLVGEERNWIELNWISYISTPKTYKY